MSTVRNFIGPYQLVRLIRSGNTTQVWEALEMGKKDRVALKILREEHRNNKLWIADLKHEASVGAKLDHKNVIKIFGFHDEHGLPLLAMQLFNARNLKIEMRENPDFIAANAKEIIQRCIAGLQHLHEKGWIHCDVKPDNFLLDDQAHVKLIDFSIAEKAKKGLGGLLAKTKTIRGTRSYMAPEQIRRQKLDVRADIYGFGCVLFEILAGRTPYTAPNPDDLLNKHLKSPVPSLEAISGASKEFASLVSRMIAKKPNDRPETMRQVGLEISRMQIYKPGKRPVARKAPDEEPESQES